MNIISDMLRMVEQLEAEAPTSPIDFDHVVAELGQLLEHKVIAHGHAQHFVETRDLPGMERTAAGLLEQARALAFTRALLRGLRDREAAIRAEAFPLVSA